MVQKPLLISLAALLVLFSIALIVLLLNWPFTRDAVAQALGRAFSSTVQIQKFRSTYFPHPGCIAEGVQITDGRGVAQLRKLTIAASWADLLTGRQRIDRITADGMYLHILPRGQTGNGSPPPAANSSKGAKLVVRQIVTRNAVLEVARGDKPLRFDVHELTIWDAGAGRQLRYHAALHNPEPPGEIDSSGILGPWKSDDHAKTLLNGSYTFKQADLSVFRYIGGTLSSKGKFNGPIERIEIAGPIQIAGFEVKSSGHPVDLSANYHAFVNGTNGDVTLQSVDAHFAQTTVVSEGGIMGRPQQHGKTISLNMDVRQGHIQDLMRMFMKSKPTMDGVVSFRAKVIVPPDGARFLKRLELAGDFGIGGGKFTKPQTQKNLDVLSERARGDKNNDENPENVISNLKGHVSTHEGVAYFSNVSFAVPGALAQLDGTYNLLNERIDLNGDLAMQAELSEATKGFKSFLLKAIDPFFKRKKAGAVVPVRITGTFSHPSYGVALTAKK